MTRAIIFHQMHDLGLAAARKGVPTMAGAKTARTVAPLGVTA